jgi:hypothetical protein
VPYREGYKGLIAECPTHGSTLVSLSGRPLPHGAAVAVQQPGEPPLGRDGRPLPPPASGQARAGDVIGQYVVCRCGVAGCTGVARCDSGAPRGASQQSFVMLVCGGGRRVRSNMDVVTLTDPPATEPNPEQPYLRNLPQTLHPVRD